jgi:PAS domain S-box-containing protein
MLRLHKLSMLSVIGGDLELILSEIVDAAIALSGADFGNIQLIDPASSVLRIVAQRGLPQWWIDFWNSVPEGQGSCGVSLQLGERTLVENVEQSRIFEGVALEMQLKAGVRAVQSTPLVSRSGKPLGMFSTHYRKPQRPDEGTLRVLDLLARQAADIVEHVNAIASLRESEERFRAMADGIPLMIWVSDSDGQARFINKAYMEFHRTSLEELKLRSWQSLIHPDDLAAYLAEVTDCLRDRRFLHAEVRVKRHDGEWRSVEVFGQPRFLSTGEFTGIAGCDVDITDRRAIEMSLQLSEQRYRLALCGSPVAVWECDTDLRFTFVDNSQPPITDAAEIIGKRDDELLSFDAVREIIEMKKRVLATGVGERREISLPTADNIAHFEMVADPIYTAQGGITGLRGLAIDISERIRSEEALRSISTELQQTLHIAATGLTHCSRDLRYLSANPAYARYVGLPLEQIIGKTIEEVMGKEAFKIIRPRIERVLRGETVEYEDEVPLAGVRKRVQVTYTPERDASGNAVGWVASVMDITERKKAEEAVRQQATMLRLSFDAIIVSRFDSGIASWNQGAETLYGFTEREAIGQNVHSLLKTVFPVSCAETEAVLKEQGTWEGELRHQTKDEREVTVSARLQCIRGDDGTIRVLEINRDITERKRLERERAEEERRKDEFLSLLGHELRNPLAAISTAVELLPRRVTEHDAVSLNEMMDRQVKLMRRLIDDLLDLGRITHGHIQLRKTRIDLATFLQNLTPIAQSLTAQRGQEMILRLPSKVVIFEADEVRLQQIATNLLSNASKYTPQGGKIEFSGDREGSEVVLRCKDNGRGIPHDMQQKIFEPFTRLESVLDSPGEASLGIGLSLVKQLVELHHGSISLESGGPGLGSEFVVRLPLEPAALDQPVAPEPEPLSISQRSGLIVLVEDNRDLAEVMVITLEDAGYRVKLFGDALSALEGVSDLKPYAILLDIGLPSMDGYKLLAKLREKPHLQATLFIGLSGFKRREAVESAGDFDSYFIKPVNIRALLSFLDKHPQPRAAEAATTRRLPGEVGKLRALLIDDHAGLAAAMAALLRAEGFEVRTSLSGQEGLQAALKFRPQLTLCDLNLPDMNGPDVIRILRSNPLTWNSYMVVLTATSDQEIRDFNRGAERMGIDEFIAKPLTAEAIRTLVTILKKKEQKTAS